MRSFFKKTDLTALITAVLFVAVSFAVTYIVNGGIFFTSNDNHLMGEILSGSFTGTPSPFTIYNNISYGYILSLLYKITDKIPWYGLSLILSISVSFAYVSYKCLQMFSKRLVKVIVLMLLAIPLYLLLTEIRYTISAAALSAAGIFAYIIGGSIRTYVPSILFFIFSFMVRPDVFYMSLPFIGFIFIAKLIIKPLKKEYIIATTPPPIFILGISINSFSSWSRIRKNNEFVPIEPQKTRFLEVLYY